MIPDYGDPYIHTSHSCPRRMGGIIVEHQRLTHGAVMAARRRAIDLCPECCGDVADYVDEG